MQLSLPSNCAGLNALHTPRRNAKGARLGRMHEVDLDWLGLALDLDRFQGLHIKNAAHVAVGIVRDEDTAHGRGVLQPAGQVDRVAHGRVFGGRAYLANQN